MRLLRDDSATAFTMKKWAVAGHSHTHLGDMRKARASESLSSPAKSADASEVAHW